MNKQNHQLPKEIQKKRHIRMLRLSMLNCVSFSQIQSLFIFAHNAPAILGKPTWGGPVQSRGSDTVHIASRQTF